MVNKEIWLTQERVADMIRVPLAELRPVVAALKSSEGIQTLRDPCDSQSFLIHCGDIWLLQLWMEDLDTKRKAKARMRD